MKPWRIRIRIILTLWLLLFTTLQGSDRFSSLRHWMTTYPQHYQDSWRSVFKSETNKTLIYWYIGLSGVAYFLDSPVQEYASSRGLMPSGLAEFGDKFGHFYGPAITSAAIPVIKILSGESAGNVLSSVEYIWEVHATVSTVTSFLKWVTHRERPNSEGYRSYPSGHTSAAFTIASITHHLCGKPWSYLGFSAATVVALSRIHDNKHYLTDVIAGGFLAVMICNGFAGEHRDIKPRKSRRLSVKFTPAPQWNNNRVSIVPRLQIGVKLGP